jgi:hypothetical protein
MCIHLLLTYLPLLFLFSFCVLVFLVLCDEHLNVCMVLVSTSLRSFSSLAAVRLWFQQCRFLSFSVHILTNCDCLTVNWLLYCQISTHEWLNPSESYVMTYGQSASLGIKHPSEAYDQIFITVRQLLVCGCGALSLTRGWVCHLQLLLALASAVILGSESCGTHDQILLCQFQDFPLRCLLRLTGLWWRYSTPPPHGILNPSYPSLLYI